MSQQVGSSSATSVVPVDSLVASDNATTNAPNDTSNTIDQEIALTVTGHKTRVLRSSVWADFDGVGTGNNVVATCKHCKRKFDGSSDKGTTHLKNHKNNCALAKRQRVNPMQQLLGKCVTNESPTPKVTTYKYDPLVERYLYAKHDYSFFMAEHDYFRLWISYIMPTYKFRSRNIVKKDLGDMFEEERARIYKEIESLPCRVSLTTDGWKLNFQNRGYFCVTCHYIDDAWELHKKVIAFHVVEYPHHGVNLSEWLKHQILEWNIDRKLSSVVVDNASNNSGMLEGIKTWLNGKNALLHNGDMFHLRCSPHIINLIVKQGLKIVHGLIEVIRKTVKYIDSSPTRDENFALALTQTRLNSKRRIPLDVETRWNSTFDMLVSALELRDAIERLADLDNGYNFLPSSEEWERGKNVCDCLSLFNDVTKRLSRIKYPTSNLYYMEVHSIRMKLLEWKNSDIYYISTMAIEMQAKFDKYWEEFNLILTIAVILDPRYKMKIVEWACREMHGDYAEIYISKVRKFLFELFTEYVDTSGFEARGDISTSSISHEDNLSKSKNNPSGFFSFKKFVAKDCASNVVKKSELEKYLEETLHPLDDDNPLAFNILHWWKHYGPKFPTLAKMARDVLAIPTSSVASESSFSHAHRVITDIHASLNSATVETLMCVKDWLPEVEVGKSGESTIEVSASIGDSED